MQQFSEEIQSKELPLFIPSPNSANNVGTNRDQLIPNASLSSQYDLSLYNLVGKLLGITLRTKGVFPLPLSSIVWKPLVGEPVDRSDLEATDLVCCQSLDTLNNIEAEGVTKDTFSEVIDFTFTTTSSDGREIELVEGGKNLPVTWDNRKQYTQLVEKYRVEEFEPHVKALVSGLTSVIPVPPLFLFSAQELAFRITGIQGFDIATLKKHAEYQGFSESDPLIVNFWNTLEKFSPQGK